MGGLLDAVSKALSIKDSLKPSKLFRLADFTEWGYVLTKAFGYDPEDFIKAMEENLVSQNTADIENNIVADAFLAYCKSNLTDTTEKQPNEDTPDNIFFAVTNKATQLNMNTKTKRWPSAACYFTRKLNDSKNAIIASNWNYEVVPKGTRRVMRIWQIKKENVPKPINAYVLKQEEKEPGKKCPLCEQISEIEFLVQYDDKSELRTCFACGSELAAKLYAEVS